LKNEFPGAQKVNIDHERFKQTDALILPIAGTNGDGVVQSIFSDQTILLKAEHLRDLTDHCVVYTGFANDYLQQLCSEAGKKVVQMLDRDDIAIYNSIPTMEGALMMAIQNTDITVHGSRTVVLGLGRVGMSLARAFHALGAKVYVGARESSHLARIYEMGLVPFHLQDFKNQVKDCDLVLNTIPAQVITAQIIARMPSHALIIDLASAPGGTDFRFAKKRGIKAIMAPGLPGIVAPRTAGQIMANVVTELITEQMDIGRD
jgi:dipicolinate synthase subunit A